MSWELDMPDLPFSKPKVLERLETLGFDQREAMDPQEIQDRIYSIAYSLAETYKSTNHNSDYESCIAIIMMALGEMAIALGGKFGASLIAYRDRAAREAAQEFFPVPL